MDTNLHIENKTLNGHIHINGSKSISNRLLIIDAIGNLNLNYSNISTSEDTQLLQKAIDKIKKRTNNYIDINHAGTNMRFLTAYLSTQEGEWILTGSHRMKERPISNLVDALIGLGANIEYIENIGYPPLRIRGKKITGGKVNINGSVSSQFISALLLSAPKFEKGITLTMEGDVVSKPYIQLTIKLLQEFGILVHQTENTIKIYPTKFHTSKNNYQIESDWSSASYWYSMAALAQDADITLSYLKFPSLQADSVTPRLFDVLGVKTEFTQAGLRLTKKEITAKEFSYNFTECPDIAQTIAATCVGLNLTAHLTGLKTLKVKETDRILALKNELEKFGAEIIITNDSIKIYPNKNKTSELIIDTYGDHRMAMCIAPLALKYQSITIKDTDVVKKSYPEFWKDLLAITKTQTIELN